MFNRYKFLNKKHFLTNKKKNTTKVPKMFAHLLEMSAIIPY